MNIFLKLWGYERRKNQIFRTQDQPNLCPILEAFDEYFNGSMSCKGWPENFFKHHDKRNETLEHEIYQYAKGQLISQCLFGTFNSPKKTNKKFDFTRGWCIKFATGLNTINKVVFFEPIKIWTLIFIFCTKIRFRWSFEVLKVFASSLVPKLQHKT